MIEHPSANVVLIANQLNLSIFQQIWLLNNNIITQDEFGPESYFSPVAVNVRNPSYDLLILPDRIQITSIGVSENSGAIFTRIISGIVNTLPHTPYTAYGFNFNFLLSHKSKSDCGEFFRSLCVSADNPLADDFKDKGARFGVYMSKDFEDGRLRMDTKPTKSESGREALIVSTNFNKDISSPDQILSGVKNWPKIQEHVGMLVTKLERYIENAK